MKVMIIAAAFLIFNIAMSVIVSSNILEGNTYYQDEYIGRYNDANFNNLSKTDIDAQSMDIFTLIIRSVSFNWLNSYIPDEYEPDFAIFILGLNALGAFLIAVGAIEIFIKGNQPLVG